MGGGTQIECNNGMQLKTLLRLSKFSAQSNEGCVYVTSYALVNGLIMMWPYECVHHWKWFEWPKWSTTSL